MNEVATNPINAVSFQDRNGVRFTKGQLGLLHLLNQKLLSKEIVTTRDIVEVYYKAVAQQKHICHYGHKSELEKRFAKKYSDRWKKSNMTTDDTWGYIAFKWDEYGELFGYEDYSISFNAMQWVTSNLGRLILKGALIAIPVIQIGDDALKSLKQ